jgi:hypothetical protein
MSVLTTSDGVGIGILSEVSLSPDRDIRPSSMSTGWISNYRCSELPIVRSLNVAILSTNTPLPNDVLNLLISAVAFAEAIIKFDSPGSGYSADTLCFEALGDMKRNLNHVTWSRALT